MALGFISIVVIWSEMTFFSTQPVLSIFARCVNAARHYHDYFTLEVRSDFCFPMKTNFHFDFEDILLFEYRLFMFMCVLYNLSNAYFQLLLFIVVSLNR